MDTGSSDYISGSLPTRKYGPLKQPQQSKDSPKKAGSSQKQASKGDQVHIQKDVKTSLEQEPQLSPSDLQRYVQILKNMPDIREDVVELVEGRLSDGYGQEALEGTIDGLMKGSG